MGAEGTQRKRDYWQYIEKRTIDWWLNNYGAAGYSLEIIKGIIKFCSYSDSTYKRLATRWLAADILEEAELAKIGLSNWNEDLSKESFSLEAIRVLSKLSLLDEPLIIVFDQLEGLGLPHNEKILLNFGEAIKEIFTHIANSLIIFNLFPDRWQQFQQIFDGSIIDRISQHQVVLNKPSSSQLKQILHTKAQVVGTDIDTLFTTQQLNEITSQNSIRAVLNKAYEYYRIRDTAPNKVAATDSSESEITTRLDSLEKQVSQLTRLFDNIAQAFNNFSAIENTETSQKEAVNNPQRSTSPLPLKQQKVIQYLEKQQIKLENQYYSPQIIDDSDDIGKLRTIIEEFKAIANLEVDILRLGKRKLPEHFLIKTQKDSYCIGFLQISGSAFTSRIKNYNSLVIANKDIKFVLWRDSRQPAISGKVAKEEIAKLNNAANGDFIAMGQENRITFELIYQLIVDIQNRDLDISLKTIFPIITDYFKNYWLFKSFK